MCEERLVKELEEVRQRLAMLTDMLDYSMWEYNIKEHTALQIVYSERNTGNPDLIESFPERLFESRHFHTASIEKARKMYQRLLEGVEEITDVFQIWDEKRQEYWWEKISYRTVFDAEGKPQKALGVGCDVTDVMRREQYYKAQAQTDSLTELYNRSTFEKMVRQDLEKIQQSREESKAAMLLIDLDNFKLINDGMGHPMGDKILIHTAKILKRSFRASDYVARVGGDELAVYMRDISNWEIAMQKAGILRDAISQFYQPEEMNCMPTCSIGIAFYPEHGEEFEILYEHADQALYGSKDKGKNRCSVYGEKEALPRTRSVITYDKIVQANNQEFMKCFEEMFDIFACSATGFGFFCLNMNTGLSKWSDWSVQYFGLPEDYAENFVSFWLTRIHPEDIEIFQNDLEPVIRGESLVHHCEYRVMNRENQYVWVRCEGNVVRDEDKNIRLLIGTIFHFGNES